jgi:hypothetical protein
MSRSVDLFVASDQPIAALAAHIAERSGLKIAEAGADGERFVFTADGLTAVLHHHEYLDDDGLPLSRYGYALSMQTQASGHLGLTREVGVLRRVSAALDDLPVLLVLDLQNRDATSPGPVAVPDPVPAAPDPVPAVPDPAPTIAAEEKP